MTIRIPVRVGGDEWYNRMEVINSVAKAGDQPVELDLGAEGPDLTRLGVVGAVLAAGVDPARVTVINWPNAVQNVPFRRAVKHWCSHFFWHHGLHHNQTRHINQTNKVFGLFVGRRTFSRCRIFYDMYQQYKTCCFMSLMNTRVNLPWGGDSDTVFVEQDSDWNHDLDVENYRTWWNEPPIGSVDSTGVWDQYEADKQTNHSLLLYYDQFDVEIVCETYCYGSAFFPTEKTIRPIAGAKPFVTFGPVGFLKRLQDLGFRTFGDFWDESYDQLEGVERWHQMKNTIDCIHQMQQQDCNFFSKLNTITKHNQQQLLQVVDQYQPQ